MHKLYGAVAYVLRRVFLKAEIIIRGSAALACSHIGCAGGLYVYNGCREMLKTPSPCASSEGLRPSEKEFTDIDVTLEGML